MPYRSYLPGSNQNERFMMNSNTIKIVTAVIAAAIMWIAGVMLFSHVVTMIFVILGITIAGYTAGVVMNTPSPSPSAAEFQQTVNSYWLVMEMVYSSQPQRCTPR